MNIYLLNLIVLLVLGVESKIKKIILISKTNQIYVFDMITYIVVFLLIFLEMGLRGDFSTDTGNYYYLFKSNPLIGLKIESIGELGFLLIIWIVNLISRSYLIFLCIIAFIMAFSYVKFMKEESDSFLLSAFILFCSGSFYSGFNVMRQFLVAACFSLCIKYIIEKDFFKYFIFVLLLVSLHSSAVFMLPIYFLMNYQWQKDRKASIKIIVIVIILGIILYFSANWIWKYITQFVYSEYQSGYRVENGVGILGTLKGIVMSGGIVLNGHLFDKKNSKERVIYNGCIIYLLITLCGSRIFLVQRFTHYFVPCIMLAYPIMLKKIKSKKMQRVWTCIIIGMFILLSINVVLDSEYYFFWDNQFIMW